MKILTTGVSLALAALLLGGLASAGENGAKKSAARSPLAALPSKPGPHVAKIRALGEKSWLDLGTPALDPKWGEGIGRAWSSTMPLAPELRGAFLYGEGRHGACTTRNGKRHYNDDLFFYDINANAWVCVYPGMEVGKYDLTVNKDGFEVNAEGHPVPVAPFVHSYRMVTYDTDRRMFVHMWSPSGYWRKHFPKRVALIEKNKAKLNGLGRGWSALNQASPWMYDTAAGHWRRFKTRAQTPKGGHGSHLIYLPPGKKFFFLGGGGTHLYDPSKNDWEALKPTGPRPPQPMDSASCYDPKRQRIYVAMGSYPKKKIDGVENRVHAYDVRKNVWIDLQAKGQLPPRPRAVSGCGITRMHYDAAADEIIFFSFSTDISGSAETRGVYAYNAEKNEWTRVAREFAPGWPRGCSHTFYDPELNAHFFFKAADSAGKGKMLVYRYRRAGGK